MNEEEKIAALWEVINLKAAELEMNNGQLMSFATGIISMQLIQIAQTMHNQGLADKKISDQTRDLISQVYNNLMKMMYDQEILEGTAH